MTLNTEAEFALANSDAVLARVLKHLAEHGARSHREGGVHVARFPYGVARFQATGDRLAIAVAGPTLTDLHHLRIATVGHVAEFARGPLAIVRSGDGADLRTPPNFRLIRVEAVEDLTPRMRRVRLSGVELQSFGGENLLVRLAFPAPGADPVWPLLGPDRSVRWPGGVGRVALRRYTIRAIDPSAGTLDIDFVRQADAGPVGGFAETAPPPTGLPPISVAGLAKEVVADLGHLARARAVGVSVSNAGSAHVADDQVLLQMAIRNLIENAVHASPVNEHVTSEIGGTGVEISVTDSGVGISGRAAAGYPLFRRDNSAAWQGSGLGLAIARTAMERIGGTIEIGARRDAPGTIASVRRPRLPAGV